jgi:thiol-disulfide isomerase/thioredoxin
LTLPDLVNRPDLWPASVTLARDFEFQGGASAKAGQAVRVLEFDGARVVVAAGDELVFPVAPADVDLLGAANEAWALLTPAQRAVDPEALLRDASLWPERITSHAGFALDDGSEIPPGGEYDFLSYDRDGVRLFSAKHRTTLVADPGQTDLIARARRRALIEPEKRPSRIAAALAKHLVDRSGKPVQSPAIEGARLYVLYFGASWCPPCRKFSPELVELVNASAKDHPRMATVLMSNDKRDEDMLEYMQEEEMPWPAVPLAGLQKSPVLLGLAAGSIPHLVVLDRHGLVLASSVVEGRYVGVDKPLATLRKLLDSGLAR